MHLKQTNQQTNGQTKNDVCISVNPSIKPFSKCVSAEFDFIELLILLYFKQKLNIRPLAFKTQMFSILSRQPVKPGIDLDNASKNITDGTGQLRWM